MRLRSQCALVVVLALCAAACHYTRRTSGSDFATIAELAGLETPPTIYDFAWLEGSWRGEGLDGEVEETWSAPADGAMVGHFRMIKDGSVAFYELMTIDTIDDTGQLGIKVKHFHPDLRGWEERNRYVTFALAGIEGNEYRFDGLTMRLLSDDEMELVLSMRRSDGSTGEEIIRYRRSD